MPRGSAVKISKTLATQILEILEWGRKVRSNSVYGIAPVSQKDTHQVEEWTQEMPTRSLTVKGVEPLEKLIGAIDTLPKSMGGAELKRAIGFLKYEAEHLAKNTRNLPGVTGKNDDEKKRLGSVLYDFLEGLETLEEKYGKQIEEVAGQTMEDALKSFQEEQGGRRGTIKGDTKRSYSTLESKEKLSPEEVDGIANKTLTKFIEELGVRMDLMCNVEWGTEKTSEESTKPTEETDVNVPYDLTLPYIPRIVPVATEGKGGREK